MNGPYAIDRPPRLQPELPSGKVKVPSPAENSHAAAGRFAQIGLPLLTLVGYILISTIGGGQQRLLLIPMALSVVATTGFSLYTLRKERQQQAAADQAYAERLRELRRDLQTAHDLQRRFYHYSFPAPAELLRVAAETRLAAENPLQGAGFPARLWERRVVDDDFATIRLGIGTRPSSVEYVLDKADGSPTPQLRAAQKLGADSRYVANVPVTVALRPLPEQEGQPADEHKVAASPPQTHALGIAGEREAVYALTRALLGHYAGFHAPGDARLCILAEQRGPWAWVEPLPHCAPDDQLLPLCFAAEAVKPAVDDSPDDDGGELEQYLESLRRVLALRKIRLQDRSEEGADKHAATPFLLVVVDLLDAVYDPTSALHEIATDAALAIILEEGAQLGAAVLFLVPERSKIPGGCQAMIEVERSTPDGATPDELRYRYAAAGVNGAHYLGVADSFAKPDDAAQLARDLGALTLRQSGGANLATTVPFLDLLGHASLTELRERATRRWRRSVEPAGANWLRTRLGLMAGNKPRTLVFSARRDGVHGIVAGSTGSGKSELLIALIAGLATSYDPSTLNFVLVDYKGGGAFREFAALPHCVDIITNLAGDGVTRMFTAIGAEMRRRQQLNAETGTKDIVEYRRKGLHLSRQPYPFLFIIIDEFAEMIAERPEYKAELESITRVGRAQGVSLILAAQRPSGVTDQMRSNIKFRICLRVETPGESRELLRRADAAFLPAGQPGRGYIQVGNEEVELIQVAYAGGTYHDPQRPAAPPVVWPERGGSYDEVQEQAPVELYKAIIDALGALAREEGRPAQRAPWPGALPPRLALTEALVAVDSGARTLTSREYLAGVETITLGQPEEPILTLSPPLSRWLLGQNGWVQPLNWSSTVLRPVAGLIDDPAGARQLPLTVDLTRGHAIVFGASGAGKTTLLRTTLLSLAASHAPSCAHLYMFDLGGRGLSALANLPHTGALVLMDDEGFVERIEQVLREIGDLVERRKQLLSDAGVDDILQYNRAHSDAPVPAIILAVDNLRAFIELFGEARDDVETALDRLVRLLRQARPYGVYVIATAAQLADVPGQLLALFSERFTLRLTEASDYRAILGAGVPAMNELSGRGYTLVGRDPLAFQGALPLDTRDDDAGAESRELAQVSALMRRQAAAAGFAPPLRVDALPRSILLRQLLARQDGLDLDDGFLPALAAATRAHWEASMDPAQADWLQAPIGIASGGRVRVLQLEAKKDGVHGMVAGGTGSGKSELLMSLIVGLALRYDPRMLNFVLVDYKGGGAFAPFTELPHCVESVTNLNRAAVRRMFTSIGAEMRHRQQLNAETSTKDIVEYRQSGLHLTHAPYPHLFIIIDEYAEMIADTPEFGVDLDSITRVGRAQGVNLLLASQRPVGVSDQMRANIKLRICLRVEGVDTSREMLRRADAAFLPNGMPGRGYIQIGNEPIELAQIAFTGDRDPHAAPNEDGEQPKFFEVAVRMAAGLASGERSRAPWPPVMPAALTLADPLQTDYLDNTGAPGTVRDGDISALNPAAGRWHQGAHRWPGVDWERTALRAVVGLADDPAGARQLPLVLDLSRGHGVVFGASGWGKTTLLRTLALSLAATHSPDDLHIHALDLGGRGLEPLRELPHAGTLITPDERGYEERMQQLWRELGEVLDRRKRLLSLAGAATLSEYNAAQPEQAEPALLLLIDNIGELIETFGSDDKGSEGNLLEQFIGLARQGKTYGLHIVVTAPRLSTLSSKLYSLFTERLALRLADADDYSAIVGARVPEIDELPGRGYARIGREALAFQVALPPATIGADGRVRGEARQIRAIAAHMQVSVTTTGRRSPPLKIDALPKSVSLQEILAGTHGISREPGRFVAELAKATHARWQHNASAEHADWLQVPIGVVSGGRTRVLRLEAKHDGVHGMVAGGTGSGKSELLMSLIVGLALNYSPDILTFVLVDYKGGGAFAPFTGLPHCVDIVTNLDPAAVVRMFTSIGAEIARRQRLNAETGTKDIVEYRRKGLHLTHAPYPHLFIIIDEYAEMIDANEAFRLALDSITRVGRAQGINLLLASQQPKGVSDQMRANIKLRLCLRVEQQDTSRELLRRPDAALLPNGMPGRGYLQVGNEQIELIQVAYAGEPQHDDRPALALWPDRAQGAEQAEEPPHFFDLVVALTRELAGGRSVPRPWPAFLPERLSLETHITGGQQPLLASISAWLGGDSTGLWPGVEWTNAALQPVVGLLDDPVEARQGPLALDLRRSHMVVLGDSGSGKTSFVRTLLLSLAATHSPDELHVYALDLGGRGLRSLEGLPHVGTVIYGDEERFEERLQRLLDLLGGLVEARQRTISDGDAGGLAEFNARSPERALPAVVVVIDNIAELLDGYEALVESALMPLARRALGAGITLLVTANTPTVMPSRLYGLFGERLTFRQSNPDRYGDIVGRGAVEIGDTPGRGYVRRDGHPLLFQAGLTVGLDTNGARPPEAEELRLIAAAMAAELAARGRRLAPPDPIRILGEAVQLADLLALAGPPPARGVELVLGLDGALRPVQLDLRRSGLHCLIAGPPRSGKTTALTSLALSLAVRYRPDQVGLVFVDLQRGLVEYGGQHTLADLPHTLAAVTEIEQLEELVAQLQAECRTLGAAGGARALYVLIDNLDELSEELESQRTLVQTLAGLIRRHGRDGLHVVATAGTDTTSNELKRRITAGGLGLALRNVAALEALRVQRTPAAVRGRELPAGRGFLVRGGQLTPLQVATPFEMADDEGRAEALDASVRAARARSGELHAAWSSVEPVMASTIHGASGANHVAGRMLALIQRGMRWEFDGGHAANNQDALAAHFARLDTARWGDPDTLAGLLRELWLRLLCSRGLDPQMARDAIAGVDTESLIIALEGELTP